ncbi:MAG: sugar phosphate isomerase/epimerase [Thermoplasmata archaeon]|nr:MAG: sugar phosphate isomerase/epimerase [Thermoplasmata archaeon]
MTPFWEMLKNIIPHFRAWEIIAEGQHTMANIKDDIKRAQDSYDIQFSVHAPFSDLNLASLNPKIRKSSLEQVMEAIRISSELEIEMVTIHPGHKSPLGAYFMDKFIATNKNSMKELDRARGEYGITLALENMPRMWISLCHDAEQIKESIEGTEIKICFDVGHANISNTIDDILELKKDFVNLHLHDNDGEKDWHLVLGQGNIGYPDILKELSGYSGLYVIESTNLEEGIRSKAILEGVLKGI